MINKYIFDDLKSNLSKFKKIKIIKFEKLAISKNLSNLSKYQNISNINIKAIKYLILKVRVIFF